MSTPQLRDSTRRVSRLWTEPSHASQTSSHGACDPGVGQAASSIRHGEPGNVFAGTSRRVTISPLRACRPRRRPGDEATVSSWLACALHAWKPGWVQHLIRLPTPSAFSELFLMWSSRVIESYSLAHGCFQTRRRRPPRPTGPAVPAGPRRRAGSAGPAGRCRQPPGDPGAPRSVDALAIDVLVEHRDLELVGQPGDVVLGRSDNALPDSFTAPEPSRWVSTRPPTRPRASTTSTERPLQRPGVRRRGRRCPRPPPGRRPGWGGPCRVAAAAVPSRSPAVSTPARRGCTTDHSSPGDRRSRFPLLR